MFCSLTFFIGNTMDINYYLIWSKFIKTWLQTSWQKGSGKYVASFIYYIANRLALFWLILQNAFFLQRMQRYNSLEKRVALTHHIKERNSHNGSITSTGGFTLMDDTFSKGMQFYCQAITNTKTNFLTAATWYNNETSEVL